MIATFQTLTHSSPVQRLLLVSLLVQVLFCLTQVGFLHPDQHFQLIEFSSWQLGEPSGATSVWELNSHIRPTLQVYLFSGFVKLCRFFAIQDAYTQLTLLRLLTGLAGFFLFNAIGIHYFKNDPKRLYFVLLLINLSWTLPYIRTLFSSEIVSSIVFFGAILLYEQKKETTLYVLLTGLLFSLAFYLRFQIAFGLLGFGLWMVLIEKKYAHLVPMALGFGIGVALNVWLDEQFYHQFVFTPYDYFRVNILEGKAAEFGTSSFLVYILILALVIGCPPLSIILFYYTTKATLTQYRQPLAFAVVFFILGHCLIGHKEERFLFPVLNVLPVMAGWGFPALVTYYEQSKKGVRTFLKGITYFSIGLNTLVLVFFLFNPYSQAIEFSRKLVNRFDQSTPTIYYLTRTPFQTESGLPLTFYRRSATNIQFIKSPDADSVRQVRGAWLVTTYNDSKDKLAHIDSLGFKPQFYSSTGFWKINEFLAANQFPTINEIWVLYRKED
ncbi:glycosyltransferase family protein [Spirosoma koreense]